MNGFNALNFDDDIEHGHVKVNGIQLHYVASGKEDAPVCILLHGFPQNWFSWRYVIPKLRHSHRVIAIDLRGYGDSDKPQGMMNYDKRTMARDVQGLLHHFRVKKALIVGHDRGARVARRLALDFPDLVDRLVLIDIMPTEYIYDSLSVSAAANHYWQWVFSLVHELPEAFIKGKEEEYLKFLLHQEDHFFDLLKSDGAWEKYLADWRQPGAVSAALNDYRASFHIDLPRYREEAKQHTELKTDTLLLWGEEGNVANLPVLDGWRRTIPKVIGEEIKGCGHYVPEEKPAEVARHIIDFSQRYFHH
ncbi:alpha/beta hydrolase [Natribacillus halophilus]|uniref:Pimeloyl-ACP methyl ester carboxylesterase n=1 Tax=Natribacillus halophilus TaxID=549003 RepID=A0A1G8SF43_9BACI|nr:alpha/beta hydrolase [Natribacillus halophilus]SDJ27872.1 Pimeloyl-ACP methyl ester carboxylesterase [Natribacillus halophilus]